LLALLTEVPFIQHTELPIPALMYGVIAIGAFALLGFIVFSYRDVANRHSHKNSSSAGH
jgi:formate-dependent nitrite reductase membrane component NrfD